MGIKFGRLENGQTLKYSGEGHILTIAPTGAGKGATSIIPFLLEYPGSVLVIDPKGENAYRTYRRRLELGQKAYILDPFGLVESLGLRGPDGKPVPAACYNPIPFISLDGDGITQADRLADTLIVRQKRESDPFWSNEARALLRALILYVRADQAFDDDIRSLGLVNELASYPSALVGTRDVPGKMTQSPVYDGYVARIAQRFLDKAPKEASGVWSTLQANLAQFLDDRRIAKSLSEASFDFQALKNGDVSIFVVLPPQYLETFHRYLRLLVASALDRLYEGMSEDTKPNPPVQFVLDEFAHLGALEAVKTAFGLSRGAGIRIWGFLQSLSQLDDIYGEFGRETFLANSGAIELFNLNDMHGLQYFSRRIGERYVQIQDVSRSLSKIHPKAVVGANMQESRSIKETTRPFFLPNELATHDATKKIILVRGEPFLVVEKVWYFKHPALRALANMGDEQA